MSSILVVEQEPRYLERVREALEAEGWQVRVAKTRDAAFASTAAGVPALVIVAGELAGAAEVLRGFSQRVGGPGALAIAAEPGADVLAAADEHLAKPFSDQDLSHAVRRLLDAKVANRAAAKAAAPSRTALEGNQVLTSADIFGDMLAEVEGEAEPTFAPTQVAPPAPLAPPPVVVAPPSVASPVVMAAPPRPAAPPTAEMDRKLEQTLSGMLGTTPRPAPRPAGAGEPRDVESMLSRTLAGLEMPKQRSAPAAAAASSPAAPAATQRITLPKPTPPPAAVELPAKATPSKGDSSEVKLPSKPPADRASRSVPIVDLAAELGELSGPRRKVGAGEAFGAEPPEVFATQRIETVRPAPPAAAPPVRPAPAPSAPPAPPPAPEPSRPAAAVVAPVVAAVAPPAPASAPPPAKPTESRAEDAREFGQYTLLDRIAIGGMAEVWKARMKGVEGFQKTVAIKKILPHLTDSVDFITMFIDEAKLAAQLNHNNIIHIYDLGKISDDYYIAMEYVEGRDLRSILNTGRHNGDPLPLGLALLIAARLASALDYAHRKRDFDNRELGLVHRDVSPQNVLISYEGDIKLCDFGIVKAVAKASKTQMGALKGKLQYMSPEQAWGRSVDARSDIFSMGSVLFEMLTGRRLFAGDSEISVLEAVRDCRIQAPRDLVASLPEDVNKVVLRALEKDPDDRYQSSGEMQKELERILYGLRPTPGQDELGVYMQRLFGIVVPAPSTVSKPSVAVASVKPTPARPAEPVKAAVERSAPTAAPVPAEPIAPTASGGVLESEAQEKKGRWLPIAAFLVVALLGAGWFLMRDKGQPDAPATAMPAVAPPAVDPAATPTESASSNEAAVEPAVAAPAETAAGVPAETAVAPPVTTPPVAAVSEPERPAPPPAATTPAGPTPAELAAQRLAAEQAAAQQAAAEQAAAAEEAARQAEAERLERERVEAERLAAAAAVAPVTPPPTAVTTAPAPPEVREGDLVTLGPGVVAPVLVSRGKTEYPPIAKRMRVQGTVVLQVLVDETGVVQETKITKPVPQNVGLNEAAVEAARGARFRPATKGGVKVKMWTTLSIPFTL